MYKPLVLFVYVLHNFIPPFIVSLSDEQEDDFSGRVNILYLFSNYNLPVWKKVMEKCHSMCVCVCVLVYRTTRREEEKYLVS